MTAWQVYLEPDGLPGLLLSDRGPVNCSGAMARRTHAWCPGQRWQESAFWQRRAAAVGAGGIVMWQCSDENIRIRVENTNFIFAQGADASRHIQGRMHPRSSFRGWLH